MTKFEEEAIKEAEKSEVIANSYDDEFTAYDIGLNIKLETGSYNFPWLEFAKSWHSDEEFQELLDKYSNLNDNYEKEVIRSSKLETSNLKLIAEGTGLLSDNAMLTKKVEDLKSQLQQQALPVVPEDVAKWIECVKKDELFNALGLLDNDNMPKDVDEWLFLQSNDDNINLILRAWLDGYTVEKPQLFYLKNKLTTSYLILDTSTGYFEHWSSTEATGRYKSEFTQLEIDSMQTGSYELVPVEDGE